VLDRLPSAKPTRDGWMARCPAHEDHSPSLSVAEGDDGRALLKCFAGCSVTAIAEGLGLRVADLMPAADRLTERRLVATYRYEDEARTHLYDALRYEPKDFNQRAADGSWSLKGVRRVVYRLPLLAGQEALFVPEGEKDCGRLVSLGLSATCNSGGAGKWTADHAAQLVRMGVKRVCVLPDNDEAGRAHAVDVARTCHAARLEVRVLELPNLPPKGDVSDWLQAGGTKADLVALAKAAPIWTPAAPVATTVADPVRRVSLIPASTIAIRPVRWLWDGRMALGSFGLLGGREGIGKSIAAYTLAADVTRGRMRGACFGSARDVVIVATEDSKAHTIIPRLMAANADLSKIHFVTVVAADGAHADLVLPVDVPELSRVLGDVKAALVILDPLLSRLDAALDSHKDAEARRALEPLAHLADSTGACFLGLIHVNKTTTSDPLTMLMASRAFAAVARWVLFAMTDPDDERRRLLGLAKSNLGRTDLPTLAYHIVPIRAVQNEGERRLSKNVSVHLEFRERVSELPDSGGRGVVDQHFLGPGLGRHVIDDRDALIEECRRRLWRSRRTRSLRIRCHSRHAMNSPGTSYKSCRRNANVWLGGSFMESTRTSRLPTSKWSRWHSTAESET
jgi:putative DNA primase/helicase